MSGSRYTQAQFVGVWTLIDWKIEYEDGGITHPFGPCPTGQLVYQVGGVMSVVMSRSEQTIPKTSGLNPDFQYEANWSIVGETLEHNVISSLNPDMVDTKQVRTIEFDGPNKLTLAATEPMTKGQTRKHTLRWRRDVNAAEASR